MIEPKKGNLQKVLVDLSFVKDKTIGEVFGTEQMPVTLMTKKMWDFIKTNNLRVPVVKPNPNQALGPQTI